jgi:hypothetical protein
MITKLLLSSFAQADCALQTVAFGGEKFTELVVGDLEHGVDVGYLKVGSIASPAFCKGLAMVA